MIRVRLRFDITLQYRQPQVRILYITDAPFARILYITDTPFAQDGMIRKEAFLNDNCLIELRRIIESSEILKEDDQVPRSSLIPCASAAAIDASRRRCQLLARVALASHARSLSSGPRRTKSEDRYAIR